MANRTGIELLPHACRVVTIRTKPKKPPRVVAFHEVMYSPAGAAGLAAELRSAVKGIERKAAVAVWGLNAAHQALRLPPADARDLEVVARREAGAKAPTGFAAPAGPLADAVVIGEIDEQGRREVGYAAAGAEELRSRLQPLVDAGFEIESAVTPALAHASLVRQRAALPPGAAAAVLSVNATATALSVVRGRVVLLARELPWGGENADADSRGAAPAAAALALRLASELRRSFVYVKQHAGIEVSRVFVCGDVTDARALTGPLVQELGIDVETLDVADQLDDSSLPEPSDRFRSRLAAWQTALALAAEPAPAARLLSSDRRPGFPAARTARRAAGACVAGLLLVAAGWGALSGLTRGVNAEVERLRRAAAALEPEMQRQDEARRQALAASARSAALEAFASQGPRFAQVLAAFSQAAPAPLALTSLAADPRPGAWEITAEGQVEGPDAASAQAVFNAFLKALGESPLLGQPAEPPSLRVRTPDAIPEPPPGTAPDPLPGSAEAEAREVEAPRAAPSGPAYIEVARDGRLYRVPLRRQAGSLELERRAEEMRDRQRQAPAAAAASRGGGSGGPAPARHPATVIDFTLRYEVAK
ncbi:MAG TPA: hypothetical protein PLE61_02495 [Vicinamibacterales bacterium]|nr:hypothetical protein [Vicinamibacterales bacterium]HPW19657.1 hypothetical protein [Vicinamibacterales bacterium]